VRTRPFELVSPLWDTLRLRGVPQPPPNATTLLVFLWSSALSSRIPGVTPAGRAALAEALSWEPAEFDAAFQVLADEGLAVADWSARLVYLTEALQQECSRPASPSTATCWRREVAALPVCDLTRRIDADLRASLGTMGPTFLASYMEGRRLDDNRPAGGRQPASQPPNSPADRGLGTGQLSPSLSLALSPAPSPALASNTFAPPPSATAPADLKKPAKVSAKAKEKTDGSKLTTYFREQWIKARKPVDGLPPTIAAKENTIAKQIVDTYGLDAGKKYVDRYLVDAAKWITDGGHPFALLPRCIDGYRATTAPGKNPQVGYSPAPKGHNTETRDVTDEL